MDIIEEVPKTDEKEEDQLFYNCIHVKKCIMINCFNSLVDSNCT